MKWLSIIFFWHSVCFSNIYQLHISYSYCILHLSSLRVFHHFFDCEKKHNKSMESRSKKPSLVPLLVFRTPFSQRISLKKKSQVSFHWASTSCLWSARETWAVSNQSSLKKGRHYIPRAGPQFFFRGRFEDEVSWGFQWHARPFWKIHFTQTVWWYEAVKKKTYSLVNRW